MNAKIFSEAMGEIDSKYVGKAIDYQKKKTSNLIRWGALAACLTTALIASVAAINLKRDRIALSDASFHVTARYINRQVSDFRCNGDLIFLTEEELFTHFDTAIFKGTVLKIRNIELNFNGEKVYRAIAQIEVEKVYRGSCNAGDTVSVLLPCPMAEGYWQSGTGMVSAMKEGAPESLCRSFIVRPIPFGNKTAQS